MRYAALPPVRQPDHDYSGSPSRASIADRKATALTGDDARQPPCSARLADQPVWHLHAFGDPIVATAILDRLLHQSHVLTIRGDSYRLREKRRAGLLQKASTASALVETST